VIGSKGTIQVGSLKHTPITVMTKAGINDKGITHWLDRFEDAYLAEMIDFVTNVNEGRSPKVGAQDARRAVAIGIVAEQSYREGRPVAVPHAAAVGTQAV
jgi:predicted dehydrogenase